MRFGIIKDFKGSMSSGIAHLVIDDEFNGIMSVPCDNGPTVRALDAMVGGCIGPGHTLLVDRIRGRRIGWDYDESGLFLGRLEDESLCEDPPFRGDGNE